FHCVPDCTLVSATNRQFQPMLVASLRVFVESFSGFVKTENHNLPTANVQRLAPWTSPPKVCPKRLLKNYQLKLEDAPDVHSGSPPGSWQSWTSASLA